MIVYLVGKALTISSTLQYVLLIQYCIQVYFYIPSETILYIQVYYYIHVVPSTGWRTGNTCHSVVLAFVSANDWQQANGQHVFPPHSTVSQLTLIVLLS